VDDAERRLRWRGEALIARASSPPWEVVDLLTELGYAAAAVAGCGLAAPDVVEGFLVDVADALVVRGCDWLTPTFPDLPNVAALYTTVLGAGSHALASDLAPKTYVAGLVGELVERVKAEPTFEAMVEARRQVVVASDALGVGDEAVGAFDDAMVAAGLLER
jgi:hypothetical protein